jgi:hypothetical protein
MGLRDGGAAGLRRPARSGAGACVDATRAALQRILLVARVDVTVLLLVVADTVTKRFS